MNTKFAFIGIGGAGNKAVLGLIEKGICAVEDTVLINSTDKDISESYSGKSIILSPTNAGCGKERAVAEQYAMDAIADGALAGIVPAGVDSVIIATSVEGGTGSGSTPLIAQYIAGTTGIVIHIVAFNGFEDDARGMKNTIDFFKDINFEADVQCIRNTAFKNEAGDNKLRAEKFANDEFAKRVNILLGNTIKKSDQNMDDTDMYKVVNTTGYKTIESCDFNQNLKDRSDFERICKNMIYDSKSLKSNSPSQIRLGVILTISPASEDAVDYSFKAFKDAYGVPFECFSHVQYTDGTQNITIISSGMKLPLEEVVAIHDRYEAQTSKVDKSKDNFFETVAGLKEEAEDDRFNMVRPGKGKGVVSTADFLSNYKKK